MFFLAVRNAKWMPNIQIQRIEISLSMPLLVVVVHLSSGEGSIDVVVIPRQ